MAHSSVNVNWLTWQHINIATVLWHGQKFYDIVMHRVYIILRFVYFPPFNTDLISATDWKYMPYYNREGRYDCFLLLLLFFISLHKRFINTIVIAEKSELDPGKEKDIKHIIKEKDFAICQQCVEILLISSCRYTLFVIYVCHVRRYCYRCQRKHRFSTVILKCSFPDFVFRVCQIF